MEITPAGTRIEFNARGRYWLKHLRKRKHRRQVELQVWNDVTGDRYFWGALIWRKRAGMWDLVDYGRLLGDRLSDWPQPQPAFEWPLPPDDQGRTG